MTYSRNIRESQRVKGQRSKLSPKEFCHLNSPRITLNRSSSWLPPNPSPTSRSNTTNLRVAGVCYLQVLEQCLCKLIMEALHPPDWVRNGSKESYADASGHLDPAQDC